MKTEAFPLTHEASNTYARGGVIFMAESDRKIAEASEVEKESPPREENQPKIDPEKVHKQVQEVLSQLQKRLEQISTERGGKVDLTNKESFRAALDALDLDEIEVFLRRIRDVDRLAERADPKLKATIAAKEADLRDIIIRRRVEALSVASDVRLGAQVFSSFQKFMGLDGVTIKTDSAVSRLEIKHTDDGQQIITVSEPTLENMISIARELALGKFSESTEGHFNELANELKVAAVWMDMHSFSPEAVTVLYNAGYQLEQLVNNPQLAHENKLKIITSYPEIFKLLHNPELQKQAIEDSPAREKAFFDIFLGRNLSVPITEQNTLYAAYFKRWLKGRSDLANKEVTVQQRAYETWLMEASHKEEVVEGMRRLIERSLRKGGKATEVITDVALQQEAFQKMLDPWRLLVNQGDNERKKTQEVARRELGERIKRQFPDGDPNKIGITTVLDRVTYSFQPDKKADVLDYVPANLIAKLAAGDRDAVACVIAISYEKEVLEEVLGEDYLVLPELTENHATLLVVDSQNKMIYRVDPNVPRGIHGSVVRLEMTDPIAQKVWEQVTDQYPQEGEEQLAIFEDTVVGNERDLQPKMMVDIDEPKAKNLRVSVAEKDQGNKTHVIMSGDKLLTSILLSNMAALGDNTYFGATGSEELRALQLAAVKQALHLSPENAMAKKIQAKLQTQLTAPELLKANVPQSDAYVDKVSSSVDLTDHLVGLWGTGSWLGGAIPAEAQNVVNMVNGELARIATARGVSPDTLTENDVPSDVLQDAVNILNRLQEQLAFDPARNADFQFVSNRLGELNRIYQARSGGGRDIDSITSFNLSPREQMIFTGNNYQQMRDFVESQLTFFGKQLRPGFPIPQNALALVNGKLDDIQKTLNSRLTHDPLPQLEEIRELAERYLQILTYPVAVAATLESGDMQTIIKQGSQQANNMDNVGGHQVLLTLMELHQGKAHMLAEEIGRRMEQIRQQKKELGNISETVISPNEYKEIRNQMINDETQAAIDGIGRYTHTREEIVNRARQEYIAQVTERTGTSPSAADIDAYIANPTTQQRINNNLREAVLVDANFANILFILDGRSSAYGTRGEDPRVYDPTSDTFVDQIYKNFVRYFIMSPAKLKVFEHIRRTRARIYITKRWGEDVWKQIAQDKSGNRLEKFVLINGIELLAPSIDKYWENKFLRVRPMLYSMKRWREARSGREGQPTQGIASGKAGEFGLFLRLLAADPLVRGGEFFSSTDPENVDLLVQDIYRRYVGEGGEKSGNRANWDADMQTLYKASRTRFGLMKENIAQFYPDELMKPFAYEQDMWADVHGNRLDPRFTAFFAGPQAAILQTIGQAHGVSFAGLSGDALAQARFKVFQDYCAPIVASIRNKNMNGIGIDANGVERAGMTQVRQTDFGRETYAEFDRVAGTPPGQGSEAFRALMAGMSEALVRAEGPVRGGRIAENLDGANSLIGRLAFDPMMEQVLRKSPLSLVDIPYWMLHGKDIFGEEHPYDLNIGLGGENQVGRWIEGSQDSTNAKQGMMEIAMGDPNQLEETMLKPLDEKIGPAVASMISGELAGEIKASIAGDILSMAIAPTADLFGLEGLPLKSSLMSKYYNNKSLRKISEAQAKTIFQGRYVNNLFKAENRAIMRELLFGKWKRRLGRGLVKILYSLFMLIASQSLLTAGEAVQGEFQG